MFADPDVLLCKAMGLDIDLTGALGGGLRYGRATFEVEDGKVKNMNLEGMDGVLTPCVSLAENVVPAIKSQPRKSSKYALKNASKKPVKK